MLPWLRPWPANLCAQLLWPTQTQARGAFSFWPLNWNSQALCGRGGHARTALMLPKGLRAANAVGCPSANNAG